MPRSIEQLISDLYAFEPTKDYQNFKGDRQLRFLFQEASQVEDFEKIIPIMLKVIEKFADVHFNYPQLVTALEHCRNYEIHVIEAAQKQPTPLNIMAINHLRGRNEIDSSAMEALIRNVLSHPNANNTTRLLAKSILEARPIEEIISDLENFMPSTHDFNARGRDILWNLCHELLDTPRPSLAIPALFAVVERSPEADFGTPGEIVHTIERIGGYEKLLHESIMRQPSLTTVELMGHLANNGVNTYDKSHYHQIFQSVVDHPKANAETKDLAQLFLNKTN